MFPYMGIANLTRTLMEYLIPRSSFFLVVFFILLSDIEIVKFVVMYKKGMFVSLILFISLGGETC